MKLDLGLTLTSQAKNNGYKTALTLIGKKFGDWIILDRVQNRYNKSYWLAQCACGKKKHVSGSSLVNNLTHRCRSCILSKRNLIHGYCSKGKTLEYHIWNSIKNRCINENTVGYKNYGGRGIKISERWKNSFIDFIKDMGKKPFAGASIDRIDNDGDYCPENCRWATQQQQMANKRKSLIFKEEKFSITQFARKIDKCRFFVSKKLKEGHLLDEIILMNSKPFKDYL